MSDEIRSEPPPVASQTNTLKVIRFTRNWGDTIGAYVYKVLSGRTPRTIRMERQSRGTHYLTVGSVLRMCDNNSIVWGSGFLTYNDDLGVLHWGKTNNECRLAPKVIHAVRGPLTRNKLIAMNVDCPAVFGDPALLFPIFYQPSIKRSYKLGVIPHFLDLASPVLRTLRNDDRVKIIRVVHSRLEYLPISNRRYLRFVDDICRCEKIVSASLHGLIVADAYGIPVHWMTMSKRATLDGFKYHDYFASVNRPEGDAMVIDRDCSFQSVMRCFKAYSTRIHVEQLLESCPFRRESVERFEG